MTTRLVPAFAVAAALVIPSAADGATVKRSDARDATREFAVGIAEWTRDVGEWVTTPGHVLDFREFTAVRVGRCVPRERDVKCRAAIRFTGGYVLMFRAHVTRDWCHPSDVRRRPCAEGRRYRLLSL